MLASQIYKNQSGKEHIIEDQLNVILPKISLRSVEHYFTKDFIAVNVKSFQIVFRSISSVGKGRVEFRVSN